MGSRPDMLTAEGVYNHLGYALLIIVFVECLRSPPAEGLAGGVSSGVICVLTFFLKPSFFMAAAALICGSFFFADRRSWKRILGLAMWPMPAAAAMFAFEIVFRSGHSMQDSLPLVGTFGLLLASEMYAGWSRAPQEQRRANSALCGFGLLCGLVLFLPEPLRDFDFRIEVTA